MADIDIIQQLRGQYQYPPPGRRSLPNDHGAFISRGSRSMSTMSDLSRSSDVTTTGSQSRTLTSPPNVPNVYLPTMPVYNDRTARKIRRPSKTKNPEMRRKEKSGEKGVDNLAYVENGEASRYNGVDPPPAYSPEEKQAPSKEKDDPWDVALEEINPGTKWSERTTNGKIIFVFLTFVKIIVLLGCLYLFICALDFLATAFRLLGGEAAGEVLQNSELLSNPVCGLMIGVLVTVLVQSSSTSTSIIVAMTSAGILSVELAIPMIMGANIGTSVTNTIVSLGQAKERNEFRRAFGGATVHDMFNWLSVLILLPLEVIAHPLYRLTGVIVTSLKIEENDVEVVILKVITKPFTDWVIKIDKGAIEDTALDPNLTDVVLLKSCIVKETEMATLAPDSNTTTALAMTTTQKPCTWHWFAYSGFSDTVAGIIMLVFALALLCICLVFIVKLLNSLLKGSIALVIKKFVNADFPGYLAFLTGYIAIIIGAVCTFVVQSSSIFTSAMTPLVGIGVITLERMYPLTLGSNIGTTATGIIAALPSTGAGLANAMQVALSHFFFNIFGIVIWYPLPFMRALPIGMARVLGNTTAKYRWFAIFYLFMMFFVLPAIAFALSVAGDIYLYVIGGIVLLIFLVIFIFNIIQRKCSRILPEKYQTWGFLPWYLHSLKPLDYVFGCRWCREKFSKEDNSRSAIVREDNEPSKRKANGVENGAFDTRL